MRMKEIKAFIRRTQMDAVVHALKRVGVKAFSIIAVEGIGALADPEKSQLSIEYVTSYSKVFKIELACREEDVNKIVRIIARLARTGEPGDGVIFVSNIEQAVKIRSGEEGRFTLDKTLADAEP